MEDEDRSLTALHLTLPADKAELVELYRALRSLSVQVVHVALRKGKESMSVLLHLVELDGSKISPQRRVLTQAAVLDLLSCVAVQYRVQPSL